MNPWYEDILYKQLKSLVENTFSQSMIRPIAEDFALTAKSAILLEKIGLIFFVLVENTNKNILINLKYPTKKNSFEKYLFAVRSFFVGNVF